MDDKDKKILKYLSEKNWASQRAVINETFQGFELSKEEYIKRLEILKEKDFVRFDRPFGAIDNESFVIITEKGRNAIKPFIEIIKKHLANHVWEILTLLFTLITLLSVKIP